VVQAEEVITQVVVVQEDFVQLLVQLVVLQV
jgi:hypothetical protein